MPNQHGEGQVKLTVYLPLPLRQAAKDAAVKHGETVSDVVRQALVRYVASQRGKS